MIGATVATVALLAGAPTLTVAELDPLRLAGAGFVARERVRVTVTSADGRRTRHVRARRGGRLRVTFRGVDVCDGVEARAVGNRGSRASLSFSAFSCASG